MILMILIAKENENHFTTQLLQAINYLTEANSHCQACSHTRLSRLFS